MAARDLASKVNKRRLMASSLWIRPPPSLPISHSPPPLMMSSASGNSGLRSLTMDGGGVTVLSSLNVVREMMDRLKVERNLPEAPLPCDEFDLMSGTGMGAVAVILLGRLRLDSVSATKCFNQIIERTFSTKKWFSSDSVFSAKVLEKVMGEIVAKYCGRADARMIDTNRETNSCKVMICASTAHAIRAGIPTCIRTYAVSANQGPDCTIVEAVRATTAAPGMFKRAMIEEQGIKIPYVGGGLECNNPTDIALRELSLVFPDRPVACVISVGSGQLHSASIPESRMFDSLLPSKLVPMVQRITTDCEKTHQDLARRFAHTKDVYFRFSTDQGMQDVDQYDSTKLSEVQAHTRNYLHDASVNTRMHDAGKAISARVGSVKVKGEYDRILMFKYDDIHSMALCIAEGNIHLLGSLSRDSIQPMEQMGWTVARCPPPSRVFTGREDILEQMRGYFVDGSPLERHLFVLCGLGGAGKTQLALKFVQLHKDIFTNIFYVDATTRETISAGLAALAKAAKAGETPEEALAWLVSQQQRWPVVLNNADDPKLNLHEFFPLCAHGDILITTRNQQMRARVQEPRAFCRVSAMQPDDALKLLLKASMSDDTEEMRTIAATLVVVSMSLQSLFVVVTHHLHQHLGFFALAIVQAGAFIRADDCGLASYLELFQTARKELMQKLGSQQTDDYHWPVYASWEISYRQLTPGAAQLLRMMSFMHHEGISKTIFEVASTCAVFYKPAIPLTEPQDATKTLVYDFLSTLRTPSDKWDPLAFKGLTNDLRSFSLLDYDTHSGTYSMHPLVQEWCRTTAPDAATVRECAAWLLSLCVNRKFDSADYALRRQLLPHLLALDSDDTQLPPDTAYDLSLVYNEAEYAKQEEKLVAIALQASRDTHGNERPTTLNCMTILAGTFRRQGRVEEAVVLRTEVLDIQKRVHGQEHPDTLTSMHNLGSTYYDQGRWQEAEALFLEVIEVRKRVIGAEHRNTLRSMAMLASTYRSQGRLSEAEALGVEVLEARQRVLGREHPETRAAMHNLACTCRDQGKLREAESLMDETVTLSKQVLGESHPGTQKSIGALEDIRQRIESELAPVSPS